MLTMGLEFAVEVVKQSNCAEGINRGHVRSRYSEQTVGGCNNRSIRTANM